ncbi:cytochrome c oxidase assembly factor 3 homolog, mitochondrial [Sardina pilchardus]|uniref:cytochrome c oxidase assembly factor 3 homolog, mitochondrial n=1 Tax=Sardina pilchardus TaxID=27697 RepID=UPI002E126FF1
MADQGSKGGSDAEFAKRIDPAKESLTREQMQFIQHVEVEQWKKRSQKLRGRNILTGLAIAAVVTGIYAYTIHAVKQERIMDEIDEEAKFIRAQVSKAEAK